MMVLRMNARCLVTWCLIDDESHSAVLGDLLWQIRKGTFKRMGLDLENLFNIRTECGCVSPSQFVKEIKKRFNFKTAKVADSHAHGLRVSQLSSIGGCHKIVHFDAHADMFYGEVGELRKEIRDGTATCGSWLFHVADMDLFDEIEIIYPDWKGLSEWDIISKKRHLKPHLEKIKVYTWSEWLKTTGQETAEAFICRSSNWTPPWLDLEFKDFCDNMAQKLIYIDCVDIKIGDYDVQQIREWDADNCLF